LKSGKSLRSEALVGIDQRLDHLFDNVARHK
jgi:hypothetical protein